MARALIRFATAANSVSKTRKPGKPPLPAATVQRVADLGALCAAGRSQPLDRPDAGEGGGREFAIGATHP